MDFAQPHQAISPSTMVATEPTWVSPKVSISRCTWTMVSRTLVANLTTWSIKETMARLSTSIPKEQMWKYQGLRGIMMDGFTCDAQYLYGNPIPNMKKHPPFFASGNLREKLPGFLRIYRIIPPKPEIVPRWWWKFQGAQHQKDVVWWVGNRKKSALVGTCRNGNYCRKLFCFLSWELLELYAITDRYWSYVWMFLAAHGRRRFRGQRWESV